MKTRTKVIVAMAALAGVMGLAMNRSPSDAQASGSVQINSREDFEAPLTPCGTWIEVSGYGRCFRRRCRGGVAAVLLRPLGVDGLWLVLGQR